jgi:phosphonoacetaldehyde hydrolase
MWKNFRKLYTLVGTDSRVQKRFKGPLKAAILDWSGTVTDPYVIAPAIGFQKVFEKKGVPISMEEARLPMGLRKDLHIEEITRMPDVLERWNLVYNRDPNKEDIKEMYNQYVPTVIENLSNYSQIIPGTRDAANRLRNNLKLKIGLTTGFTRPMADVVLEHMRAQGFEPDVDIAGDEVENGIRPQPFMLYKNLEKLGVFPIQSVVKVDDTVSGIEEGLNAGCWTVGLSRYSNYMNINSYAQESQLSQKEIDYRNNKTKDILSMGGAHYVIDSIKELPDVCYDINSKLNYGIHP